MTWEEAAKRVKHIEEAQCSLRILHHQADAVQVVDVGRHPRSVVEEVARDLL